MSTASSVVDCSLLLGPFINCDSMMVQTKFCGMACVRLVNRE